MGSDPSQKPLPVKGRGITFDRRDFFISQLGDLAAYGRGGSAVSQQHAPMLVCGEMEGPAAQTAGLEVQTRNLVRTVRDLQ